MHPIRLKTVELLLVVLLLAGFVFVNVSPVSACSCMASTPAEEFADAGVVFAGTVSDLEEDAANDLQQVTFDVLHTWKGESYTEKDEIVVTTPLSSAACGYPFELDEPYLVYVHLQAKDLTVGLCSNTAPLLDALSQLAIVGTDEAASAAAQPVSPLAAPTSPLATPTAKPAPTATPKS